MVQNKIVNAIKWFGLGAGFRPFGCIFSQFFSERADLCHSDFVEHVIHSLSV